MKFLETNFIDYIEKCNKKNLHEELIPVINNLKKNLFKTHVILYGPSGVGKYTQVLNLIKDYSPTNLKYERKINFNFNKKYEYIFKISDIHYEIDMELLGCHSKILWNEIYYRILDSISTKSKSNGIIICKNFHKIHSELLDIFYSYMQTLNHKNIKLTYVILTEQISFLPNNILNRCHIIDVKRPSKSKYSQTLKIKLNKDINVNKINNIKSLLIGTDLLFEPNKKIVGEILMMIRYYKDINYLLLRDKLYEIFIYNLNLNECIWEIFKNIVDEYNLSDDKINLILLETYNFFKFYNNNYRPIYHLEKLVLCLCKIIYEL
jgi:hypothetical protein